MRALNNHFSQLTCLAFVLCALPLAAAAQTSAPGWTAPPAAQRPEPALRELAGRKLAPRTLLQPEIKLEQTPVFALSMLAAPARRNEAPGFRKRQRVGQFRTAPAELLNLSAWQRHEVPGGSLWLARVASPGAAQVRLQFDGLALPAGASLFVYAPREVVGFAGPYTGQPKPTREAVWTPPFNGPEVVLEYFLPADVKAPDAAPFHALEIGHLWRALQQDDAGPCNREVPPEWRETAKAVALLNFGFQGFMYSCTGTLLNTTNNSGAPYLLTANHCVSRAPEAQSTFALWFKDGPSNANTRFNNGADLLATGLGGDFTLLRLREALPPGVHFAGWSGDDTAANTAVTGLHHPQGSYKRASFGTTTSSACPPEIPAELCDSFQSVRWNAGITEPGSSGSGLFAGGPTAAQVTGVLSGGLSSCSNPGGLDFYGRLSRALPAIRYFLTGNGCGYLPERPELLVGPNAATHSLKLNIAAAANANCPWQAASRAPWLRVVTESGQGAADIRFEASANPGGEPRTGFLSVAGQLIAVTQAGNGNNCRPAQTVVSGNIYTVNALSTSDCRSTLVAGAFADRHRLTAQAGQQIAVLVGAAEFPLLVALFAPDGALLSASEYGRLGEGFTGGYLTLATAGDYIIEVTSLDPGETGSYVLTLYKGCSCTLSDGRKSFGPDGGAGEFTVTTQPDCPWIVEAWPSWVTITTGASGGRGPGRVGYTVTPLAGTNNQQRRGNIRVWVRDGPYTTGNIRPEFGEIVQSLPCTFEVRSRVESAGVVGAGNALLSLSTANYCEWTVQSDSPWLRLEGRATGSLQRGPADFNYVIDSANLSPNARTGTLTFGTAQHRVTQPGFGANCRITPVTAGQPLNSSFDQNCVFPSPQFADARVKGSYHSFSGVAGQQVAVGLSGLFVPVTLWLAGPDGRILANDEAGWESGFFSVRAPALGFVTLPETGTYYVLLGSSMESPAARHGYTLTVQTTTGTGCRFAPPPLDALWLGAGGGAGNQELRQEAGANCGWQVTSSASWLTVTGAANGSGTGAFNFAAAPNPGDRARVGFLSVAGWHYRVLQPQTPPVAVVSSASFGTRVALESLAALFGTNLATGTGSATRQPLPTALAGTEVLALGRSYQSPLPLLFVSPGQINLQMPFSVGRPGARVNLEIRRADGWSQFHQLQIEEFAPAFYAANANGGGVAAAVVLRVRADQTQVFEPVAQLNANNRWVARPIDLSDNSEQVFLLLFGTGMRRYNFTPGTELRVSIGGQNQEISFFGAQPDLVGLDQINVRLSPTLRGRGEVPVVLSAGAVQANTVTVSFR